MSALYITLTIVPVVALAALFIFALRQKSKGVPGKRIVFSNLIAFAMIFITVGIVTFSVSATSAKTAAPAQASASETTQTTETAQTTQAAQTNDNSKGLGLIAAALVTGISGIGGGIAVAAGAPAAIAATSEDSKSFGKSLIFVALGESIALYGVVISILILNKI